ncbi:MAG TPA: helix-turn-helix transcriptional regulator [Thermoanaerobaculia bacterium]|jgi:AraC-like DNA-binding protein|nr:helix-turn-helix transcriptional regulator [Thermoanaerobaculia bacterium]
MECCRQDDTGDWGGIAIDWLFASPAIRVARWDCHVAGKALSPERQQPLHVVAFAHAGSYVLHDRRGRVLVDATRVTFVDACAPFQTSHPYGCGDRGSSLMVRGDLLAEALAPHDPGVQDRPAALFRLAHAPVSPRTALAQRLLVRRLESPVACDPLAVEETALGVLETVLRESFGGGSGRVPASRETPGDRRQRVEAARGFLLNQFRSVRRLAEVAAAAGVSPFHLCRIFKAETGTSVHAHLNRLRLRAALGELLAGVEDLTDLALDLGYSSHSHFTAAFHREYGLPPSAVRTRQVTRPARRGC